jgi:hypothetical protein
MIPPSVYPDLHGNSIVDPGNAVPRKYFDFQERLFNFGWQKVLGSGKSQTHRREMFFVAKNTQLPTPGQNLYKNIPFNCHTCPLPLL